MTYVVLSVLATRFCQSVRIRTRVTSRDSSHGLEGFKETIGKEKKRKKKNRETHRPL